MNDRFRRIFKWNGDRLEDTRFWCEPQLTQAALFQIKEIPFDHYDGLASFEARGFFLLGVASNHFQLPSVFIRKNKKFFEKMNHHRVDFRNWKNEPESLVVLKDSLPEVKRVLIVDDILDTGRSLEAGQKLLSEINIEIVGAFYLLDASKEDIGARLGFPIYSAMKHQITLI